MTDVFLVRCNTQDFETTVETPVDLAEADDVPANLPEKEVRVWGVPSESGNNDYFEKMENGSVVLFHTDGVFIGVGQVGVTVRDSDQTVSDLHWSELNTSQVFTVEGFESVNVPKHAVNRIFGYSDSYTPGEVMRVADDRVSNRPEAIKLALKKYTKKHGSGESSS